MTQLLRGATHGQIIELESDKVRVLTALNKADEFIVAIGVQDRDQFDLGFVRRPFLKEPDFMAASDNDEMAGLLAQSREPA
jgi:hypothetical protein